MKSPLLEDLHHEPKHNILAILEYALIITPPSRTQVDNVVKQHGPLFAVVRNGTRREVTGGASIIGHIINSLAFRGTVLLHHVPQRAQMNEADIDIP